MAKLVQVTYVEEAITYWENGMLMCRGTGENKRRVTTAVGARMPT